MMRLEDLQAITLMGPIRKNPVSDPLDDPLYHSKMPILPAQKK